MIFQKKCMFEPCGKEFRVPSRDQKYCSRTCARRANMVSSDDDIREYLLRWVSKSDHPDGCWLWQRHISKKTGYGIACFRGQHAQAHRVSYEFFVGPIPNGLHVLHVRHCLHRHCINPRHLYCGTNTENMADKVAVGRAPHGRDHCNTHLTEADVLDILQKFHAGTHTQKMLGAFYGITRETVRSMIKRETWCHVAPGQFLYVKPQTGKMNEDDVRAIRRLHDQRIHANVIAQRFKITPEQARNIGRRISWKNVSD